MVMDLAGSRPSYLIAAAEPDVLRFLEAHVTPGSTVYDLGANVGYFTLIAAALTGSSGKVVAYEPLPANATALRRNVELNALTNVEVVEAAVGGSSDEVTLRVGVDNQQASLVATRTQGSIRVASVTLDDEARRIGVPSVIKCDIEGAEHEAFAAAVDVLESRPAIVCEVHLMQPGDRERFVARLEDAGYAVEWINDEGWSAQLVALPRTAE
jgi:FkbM family methyltransferase